MFYRFLQVVVRFALKFFFRRIVINRPEYLKCEGPILLAANHPNSFLDAIILDALFEKPIWSLARGDAFRNRFIRKILHQLCILPVYRDSEGTENLSINYTTFATCQSIFRKNGLVLIFSEGRCINEWKLRPLKKGTARLAIQCWQNGIPLKVLPIGINYSSFRSFGKDVHLNLGEFIDIQIIADQSTDGAKIRAFNNRLEEQLLELVSQSERTVLPSRASLPSLLSARGWQLALIFPAISGWILHAPLHLPVRKLLQWKFRDSDHYDSLLFALHLIFYPAYLLLIGGLMLLFSAPIWSWWLLPFFPLTAWCWLQWKVEDAVRANQDFSIAA